MTTSKHPHLIDLNDYPVSWWKEVVDLGEKIKNNPEVYSGACHNKIMATLFYEPSTRTQMSFQTAMLRLGGRLIGFDNPANSSVSKGETLKDTTKIVSNYADILVMRHPVAGAAKAAALSADCPVINAGDSGHLHPTQTLTDLLTLKCEKGRLDHLTIGLCGDLINGRTVHSLIKAMTCFEGNQFILISTPELKLPSYVKDILTASGCPFREVDSLEEVLPELDLDSTKEKLIKTPAANLITSAVESRSGEESCSWRGCRTSRPPAPGASGIGPAHTETWGSQRSE